MNPRMANLSRRFWIFLLILGPGIITANVDNDAGGITTYSVASATLGYKLLWTIIPMTLALIVVQEMCARMGAVTGKGLADLIRERTGVKWTAFIMLTLLLADLGNTICEFAGVAASMELFGVVKYIAVPLERWASGCWCSRNPINSWKRSFWLLAFCISPTWFRDTWRIPPGKKWAASWSSPISASTATIWLSWWG